MITVDEVRRVFHYDPSTGVFMRIEGGLGIKRKHVNVPLGCPGRKGHLRVGYQGTLYRVHRLIWLYMTGSWPTDQIDHVNRNPSDNRWSNLRQATHAENIWNQRSKNRRRGVYVCKWTGRYSSTIRHNGKSIWLGRFDTADEASTAYEEASKRLRGSFHPS